MRRKVTVEKLREFMEKLGQSAKGPGAVFLVGGATALLLGIREQTIDVDIKIDPEPKGVFEAIAALKNEFDLNVELASPEDFIPVPYDWRQKSIYIDTINGVSFYHYDLVAQALAKIERGYDQDLRDVRALIRKKLIIPSEIKEGFLKVKDALIRYPSINPEQFEKKVTSFIDGLKDE